MSDLSEITMFVCANCARPGKELTSSGRSRPVVPDFRLPESVQQVIVPCAGRLQPENILKALEAGSRVVSVIACREDNCHFAEGSRRCDLRVEYIRSILQEIGLGEGRLLLSHLPGSAAEDLAQSSGGSVPAVLPEEYETQLAEIRDQIMESFRNLPPNPLRALSLEAAMRASSEEDRALSKVGGHE